MHVPTKSLVKVDTPSPGPLRRLWAPLLVLVLPVTPHIVIAGEFHAATREVALKRCFARCMGCRPVPVQVALLRGPGIVAVGHRTFKVSLVALAVLLQLDLGVIALVAVFVRAGEGVFGLFSSLWLGICSR